jgi:hypothetical protein
MTHPIVSTTPPEQRRKMADRQITSLTRQAAAAEADGAYSDAQRIYGAIADWDFWADYGVTSDQFAEANQSADDDPCPCRISHTRSEHGYDPDRDEEAR